MANDLFVHHAVSGGSERSGPFKSINEAIQKACALLKTHGPTAIVSIHDNGRVIMGGNEVRKRCEAEQ
jgi:triosephosphate isomerase